MSDSQTKILNRFFTYLKIRLNNIKKNKFICGKLTTNKYGLTKRCYGEMANYGCNNCNPNVFSCKYCGDNIVCETEFCTGYCSWRYCGKPDLMDHY